MRRTHATLVTLALFLGAGAPAAARTIKLATLAPLLGALVVSTKTPNVSPGELKPELLASARAAQARLQKARRLGREAIKVMREHGLKVHPVPEGLIRLWERRARLGYPRLASVVPSDLVAEVERLRNAYRARHSVQ